MGLCIELTGEAGTVFEVVTDDGNVLHRLLPPHDDNSSPTLASVDWYGDTVFNAVQMKRFLAEWDHMAQRATSREEQALAATIRAFAERCRDEVHLYLKFIGD